MQRNRDKSDRVAPIEQPALARAVKLAHDRQARLTQRLSASSTWTQSDIHSGRYRVMLYRFLVDHLPIISACLWTWVRLASAPGKYRIIGDDSDNTDYAEQRLDRLWRKGYADALGNRVGLATLMPDLFASLFRDGRFGGFVTVHGDGSGVDQFVTVDPANIVRDEKNKQMRLFLDLDPGRIDLHRPDFYFLPFNNSPAEPLGRSLFQPIPFVSYIEQQLVDDMRRTSHNAGFHRLHVKLTPPERMAGEADETYTGRINGYFDSTVSMIRSCDIDDNPVTWDNVAIEYIGPDKSREVSNSWFMNHRAMIEDICAGTNLAPHLLGYSYGATTTWANFKFDVVMRQIRSVQAEVAQFLEWLGNIDLALAGSRAKCQFVFDNTFAYQAADRLTVESGRIDNILKLYNAGLIDKNAARERAGDLI